MRTHIHNVSLFDGYLSPLCAIVRISALKSYCMILGMILCMT